MIRGKPVMHSIAIKSCAPDCLRFVYGGEIDFPQLLACVCSLLTAPPQRHAFDKITQLNLNFRA